MHLADFSVSNFRNYTHGTLTDLPYGLVYLVGPNGAGKTNILEAISLLAPGRGLRGADLSDVQNRDVPREKAPWALHAHLVGAYGPQELGLGLDPQNGRRVIKLNGAPLKNQAERADLIRCAWLTPREDRVFLDGASARRKLFDRWVFTHDPAHAGRITRLDRLLSERNRLLALTRTDPLWLDAVEADLAATAVSIAAARVDYMDRLRAAHTKNKKELFPRAIMFWHGEIENRIGQDPSVLIEQDYTKTLRSLREKDRALEATSAGPHRSDVCILYQAKNMPASDCSTGEQKALLGGLFLAHATLIRDECGHAPILLLDEITAHLDAQRRDQFIEILMELGAQIFITATSAASAGAAHHAHVIQIENGLIQASPPSLFIKGITS